MRISDAKIQEYLPLVRKIALKMRSRLPASVDYDDLVSAGLIGLMQALDKFDASKGFQFKTFAEFRIRGAMIDELRTEDWAPKGIRHRAKQFRETADAIRQRENRPATKEELAAALAIPVARVEELERHVQTLDSMNAALYQPKEEQTQTGLRLVVDQVECENEHCDPFHETFVHNLREVLENGMRHLEAVEHQVLSLYYFEELNLKEIGARLELCESRVSQIHSKALRKLKGKLDLVQLAA